MGEGEQSPHAWRRWCGVCGDEVPLCERADLWPALAGGRCCGRRALCFYGDLRPLPGPDAVRRWLGHPAAGGEGAAAVFDFSQPGQGILAQRVLAEAGVRAVLTPYKLLDRGLGLEATPFVVHRVEVPAADAGRAAAVLDAHGLPTRRAD
jgi:hypothetical protein